MRTRCRPRWHRSVEAIGAAAIAGSLIAVPGLTGAGPSAAAAAVNTAGVALPGVSGTAPGGPGATSYMDVARKDCFGTAQNTTSKVWFTVADGVLSDAYYPTIESSNVKTVQYIVTDGKTFADLQERDMTYTVSAPDRSGMVCQVTSTDARHGFQIVTDYITDPGTDSIVMHSRLVPLPGHLSGFGDLKVYVRYNPHIDNTGGGGSSNGGANNADVDPATTALVATDTKPATGPGPFAATVYGALAASKPFRAESAGFAGTPSDGLSQLDASHALTNQYQSADDGNVALTALVNAAPGTPFTLALGFGSTAVTAINSAERSGVQPFGNTLERYLAGWRGYDSTLRQPPNSLPGLSAAADAAMRGQYWLSANVLKADEDKTYLGAFVASPTDPWGQSVPATTTHPGWTYREVFTRDSYETFTGLLADGDLASARAMVQFLYDKTQQPDGSFPRDSLLNGAIPPDTFGLVEIDEDAYPLLMAWEAGLAGNVSFYQDHIRPDADFIVDHGPAYGAERWEEHPGFSPADIAAEIAGLVAAAHLAQAAGDPVRARLYLATADYYQRNVERWTVTTTGPYASRYFIRLSPTGNPNVTETYDLGNGSLSNVDQRDVIDASFLELTRLGELAPDDPAVQESLPVVDSSPGKPDRLRPGVAPLWRQGRSARPAGREHRRLRRLLRARPDELLPDRSALVPHRHRIRSPVAAAERRARRTGPAGRRRLRCRQPGRNHAADVVRPRPGTRTGLGGPRHSRLPVRQRPEDRLDRVHQREGGRLRRPAHLGPGAVPPARARRTGRTPARPASHYPGPLRHQRPSGDRAADHQRHGTRRGGDPAQHVDGCPGNHRGHPGQPGARPDHPAGPGHGQREDHPGRHRRHRGQPARHLGQHDGDRPDRGRLRWQLPRGRPDPVRPEHPHRVRHRRRPRDRLGPADRDRQLATLYELAAISAADFA